MEVNTVFWLVQKYKLVYVYICGRGQGVVCNRVYISECELVKENTYKGLLWAAAADVNGARLFQ